MYLDPEEVEITFSVRRKDQTYERLTGIVDTGAEVSLLPRTLLDKIGYRPSERLGELTVDQAGIAKQSFSAIEGYATFVLEDQYGSRTPPFEARVWFADTDIALIGFEGILNRAVLHIDMLERIAWLNINT
ncbi:MAG: hypothetical protein U0694_10570 [Anaerolineae bacterium]